MAAHDEKISTNRRRLFKALSSVPVVMTLRPGSALANSSLYQCAEKIADPNTDPTLLTYGPIPTPGFATEMLDYFPLQNVPSSCLLQIASDFVVYIDGALYGNLSPGIAITTGFTYDPGAGGAGSGTGSLMLLNNVGQTCQTIAANSGNFALLDSVTDDNMFTGVPFPKANPLSPGLQGITGTCLASIAGMPMSGGMTSG